MKTTSGGLVKNKDKMGKLDLFEECELRRVSVERMIDVNVFRDKEVMEEIYKGIEFFYERINKISGFTQRCLSSFHRVSQSFKTLYKQCHHSFLFHSTFRINPVRTSSSTASLQLFSSALNFNRNPTGKILNLIFYAKGIPGKAHKISYKTVVLQYTNSTISIALLVKSTEWDHLLESCHSFHWVPFFSFFQNMVILICDIFLLFWDISHIFLFLSIYFISLSFFLLYMYVYRKRRTKLEEHTTAPEIVRRIHSDGVEGRLIQHQTQENQEKIGTKNWEGCLFLLRIRTVRPYITSLRAIAEDLLKRVLKRVKLSSSDFVLEIVTNVALSGCDCVQKKYCGNSSSQKTEEVTFQQILYLCLEGPLNIILFKLFVALINGIKECSYEGSFQGLSLNSTKPIVPPHKASLFPQITLILHLKFR
ncbi:hypothetical protein VP01_945g1 [Puccinia sorghi]|uniref:Uncharacterized protein n=1 Tax=Puccinia sorghi TaxID=27349 RepID=A0A0L6U732_9BASI|nr:hypothetical protein VP01_945g1 [Puccinia sorghi]